jgi:hypothetical protein
MQIIVKKFLFYPFGWPLAASGMDMKLIIHGTLSQEKQVQVFG